MQARIWVKAGDNTCMGMRPSHEYWKLAQLLRGCTSHSSTRHSVKNAITKVRSRSCSNMHHTSCWRCVWPMGCKHTTSIGYFSAGGDSALH